MDIVTYDSMESICNSLENVKLVYSLNLKLIRDIDLICSEICNRELSDLDIYDVCVSCGSDLTYDQEYTVYDADIKWMKTEGFKRFLSNLAIKHDISDINKYNLCINIYAQILDLFSIQVSTE
jgi:hypothetical protein